MLLNARLGEGGMFWLFIPLGTEQNRRNPVRRREFDQTAHHVRVSSGPHAVDLFDRISAAESQTLCQTTGRDPGDDGTRAISAVAV